MNGAEVSSTVWPAVVALIAVSMATIAVGSVGMRMSRTTSDFYVASRAVKPWWNASAIGGEYLSAASFLGVAGLMIVYGADVLWYPVGYTAGYVVLLALVAAPLRRSGAYTLPDFAEIRLGSTTLRRMASLLVVGIGWLYLLPQFHGAGLAMRTMTGAPAWVGALAVALIVLISVVAGGMRSITFVQGFQFWLKLTAIAVPVVFMVGAWIGDGSPDPARPGPATTPAAVAVTVSRDVMVAVEVPTQARVTGSLDGRAIDQDLQLNPGTYALSAGTQVKLPAGAAVPHLASAPTTDGAVWASASADTDNEPYPLYRTYSLLLALLFGTMGLPHVLVRFYTNPDGPAARRTTLAVLPMLGVFYLFPPFYAALGRLYAPDLLLSGRADSVVLQLPGRMIGGLGGDLLTSLVVAGAFAAFLSTSSGLTVSVAGVLSQDLMRGRWRSSVQGFRLGAVLAVLLPLLLSLLGTRVSIVDMVGLAFAVAASTLCPLLVLGIWWRGLTRWGAGAGLTVGGLLALGAVLITMTGGTGLPFLNALLAQPAAWTVPLVFLVMVSVSLGTRSSRPKDVSRILLRLHAPERLHLEGPAVTPGASRR